MGILPMKKLTGFLLAATILMGAATPGQAVEFKVRGSWQYAFDYIQGGSFMGKNRQGQREIGQQWAAVHQKRDNFEAIQRLHLQLHAVASENLSGTVFFEIGEQRWGMAAQGGALGADGGNMVKIKQSYLDWRVPGTGLKLRMGLQGMKLPGFAMDSPVLHDDLAALSAAWTFSPKVTASAAWMRLLNDNWQGDASRPANFIDNFDLVALTVPVTLDGLKFTPWAMAGGMGPNSLMPATVTGMPGGSKKFTLNNPMASTQGIDGLQLRDGLYPAAFSTRRTGPSIWDDEYSTLYWGGITGDWTALDPFRVRADFVYGGVKRQHEYLNRQGWYSMLVMEYATDWGLPGIYGWYFSGDDDNPHNGSERLPYIATTNNLHNSLSTFGYRGNPSMGGAKGVLGTNPSGTWGIGARVKDLSFLENLRHTLRLNYFGGTNSPEMAKYITGRKAEDGAGRQIYRNNTDFNSFGTYLTTEDKGMEINLDSTFKATENLNFFVNLGYIHLWLDKDVWGRYQNTSGDSLNVADAWKASLTVVYSF